MNPVTPDPEAECLSLDHGAANYNKRPSVVHVEMKMKHTRTLNAINRVFENMSVSDLFQPIEESFGRSGDFDGVAIAGLCWCGGSCHPGCCCCGGSGAAA